MGCISRTKRQPGTYYSTLPYGAAATEDGLVWLKTGSGSPALYNNPNLAVSVYYENTSSAWQLEDTMFPSGGYSGDFLATSSPTGGESGVISNPLIVSSESIPVIDLAGHPNETFQQGLFYLQFLDRPRFGEHGKSAYSTYAQAVRRQRGRHIGRLYGTDFAVQG